MANTFKFGNGQWAVGKETALAYNDENSNFKPLPFSFDRASTATVVNKNGLIETVGVDEPRIDFLNNTKGHLLLEPSRRNEVTSSDLLPNLYWGTQGCTISSSSDTTSPDGASEVAKLAVDITGTFKGIRRQESTAWNGKTITISTFVKYINSDYIFLYTINAVGGTNGVWFNIANGTIGTTQDAWSNAKVEDYGNGWYRCSANVTFNAAGTCYLYILDANNHANVSSTTGNQAYIWGTQVEEGSYATSYIPTSGSAVTRSAETAVDAGNSTVFNDSEGVLYAEIAALANDGTGRNLGISDGTTSNRILVLYSPNTNELRFFLAGSGGSITVNYTLTEITEFIKVAIKYKAQDFSFYVNGFEIDTNTSNITFSGFNDLSFNNPYDGGTSPFYGKVKDLKVYNTALSDSELQALTS